MASKLCRNVWSKYRLFQRIATPTGHRTLLSAAYPCNDAWQKRLDSSILQKVEVADFAMRIFDKFEKDDKASALDIDILANKLEKLDVIQLDFAQNLFDKFRHTQEAAKTLDSTNYALMRALLSMGEYDRLLQILKNKIGYGVFLDSHLANILLDCFIENKMYQEAAEIAYDQMLQEDFEHPITWLLSWYACHLHWENPVASTASVKEEVETSAQPDDEEEELDWIRVNFLERPFYDDHFDIPKDSQKLGKTFTMVGKRSPDLLGRSYQLIGWGLYEKFDKGLELARQWLDDASIQDAVSQEALDSFQATLEGIETQEPPTEEKEIGMMSIEDLYPYITAEMKEAFLEQSRDVQRQLKSAGKIVADLDLTKELLSRVNTAISEHQDKDTESQTALFKEWILQRDQLLQDQVEKLRKQTKQEELAKRLVALQEKEERLRYFEELDRIKIGMSKTTKEKAIKDVAQDELFVLPPGERGKGVA